MKAIFAPLLALAVPLAWPVHAESLDALYAKAKSEGALMIYGGGPARVMRIGSSNTRRAFPASRSH